MIRKTICILSTACLLLGVNACTSGSGNAEDVQVATDDSPKTSLDWAGTYAGILPCADCDGIETEITLKEDNTYRITWRYTEKNDEVYTENGTFIWNADGNKIILENLDAQKVPTLYKVCENSLLQLDLKGNEITGELAENYRINKK